MASYLHAMNEAPTHHPDGAGDYEIAFKGRLTPRWDAWFDGLTVSSAEDATTVLTGFIVDQAALHGVLRKLADLGLPLISVTTTRTQETQ